MCQDWPGPADPAPLSEDAYLCADDVSDDARVHGLVAFLFACFGAGTPEWDDFAHRTGSPDRDRLAAEPLMSALPRRLLAHPRGGALAVAGHVDRAWGYSFSWPGAGRQTEIYRSCLARLLRGHPIGSAFDYVNQRYAELASDLATALEEVEYGRRANHLSLSTMWTANNDARGFVILGDPAVRLFAPLPPDAAGGPENAVRVQKPEGPLAPGGSSKDDELPHRGRRCLAQAGPDAADGQGAVAQRLTSAVEELVEAIDRMTDGLPKREVAVYSSKDVSTARYNRDAGDFTGAHLRAVARVGPAGDLRLLVPEREGRVDSGLGELLLGAVQAAREVRHEQLRELGASLRALIDAVKEAVEDVR